MNHPRTCVFLFLAATALWCARAQGDDPLYSPPPPDAQSRWASFENPSMARGGGGTANKGGKGAAFSPIKAGETKVLLETAGAGTIHRMWCTLQDRSPESLRSQVLRFYWDGAERPAVEVPLGDFFGAVFGRAKPFESALFSSPEGRSFTCCVPMPFRRGARVTLTNESGRDLPQFFYDIDCTLAAAHEGEPLYFHAVWRRDPATVLARDFEVLPRVAGAGRFLGAHIGVSGAAAYSGWWGEGEVKMYLDGDGEWPTIVGTGTEDYIGTGYGQGEFSHQFQGCFLSDNERRLWSFYRLHVPDPVWFHRDIRVTLQQMGGANKREVLRMKDQGAPMIPVTVDGLTHLLAEGAQKPVESPEFSPDSWVNFYRSDDVCSVAFFYLDKPENGLPPIAPCAERVAGLKP